MLVNPETKIGPLLDEHPELEAVLVGLSPEFKRLQNPILRKTVARVGGVLVTADEKHVENHKKIEGDHGGNLPMQDSTGLPT